MDNNTWVHFNLGDGSVGTVGFDTTRNCYFLVLEERVVIEDGVCWNKIKLWIDRNVLFQTAEGEELVEKKIRRKELDV